MGLLAKSSPSKVVSQMAEINAILATLTSKLTDIRNEHATVVTEYDCIRLATVQSALTSIASFRSHIEVQLPQWQSVAKMFDQNADRVGAKSRSHSNWREEAAARQRAAAARERAESSGDGQEAED